MKSLLTITLSVLLNLPVASQVAEINYLVQEWGPNSKKSTQEFTARLDPGEKSAVEKYNSNYYDGALGIVAEFDDSGEYATLSIGFYRVSIEEGTVEKVSNTIVPMSKENASSYISIRDESTDFEAAIYWTYKEL